MFAQGDDLVPDGIGRFHNENRPYPGPLLFHDAIVRNDNAVVRRKCDRNPGIHTWTKNSVCIVHNDLCRESVSSWIHCRIYPDYAAIESLARKSVGCDASKAAFLHLGIIRFG